MIALRSQARLVALASATLTACAIGEGEAAVGHVDVVLLPEGNAGGALAIERGALVIDRVDADPAHVNDGGDDPGHGHAHLRRTPEGDRGDAQASASAPHDRPGDPAHALLRHAPGDDHGEAHADERPAAVDLRGGAQRIARLELLAGSYDAIALFLGADEDGCALRLEGEVSLGAGAAPVRLCLPPAAEPIPLAIAFEVRHEGTTEIELHLDLDGLLDGVALEDAPRAPDGSIVLDGADAEALAAVRANLEAAFESHARGAHR